MLQGFLSNYTHLRCGCWTQQLLQHKDNLLLLVLAQFWEDWQAQNLTAKLLSDRQAAWALA